MEPRGKSITTSVPSISIKFHANAEQLEEVYASDEEHPGGESAAGIGSAGVSEPESSPLKYFPRLVKRSTSIDITPNLTQDASPPSDPWRFFSDIKGKITKSVEEKITEIKSRNQEEGSPLRNKPAVKDNSKDNSSISDSEDLSESSISKTCGIVSTTEGAEMSSDEDTPSIEKDKKTENRTKSSGLRQRFRLLKPKTFKEGTISKRGLVSLYNINTEKIEQALPEEVEIESGVDALEDTNLQNDLNSANKVMEVLGEEYDNIQIDKDNVINVKEVSGNEVKQVHWSTRMPKTIYAPVGFVDMRTVPEKKSGSFLIPVLTLVAFSMAYIAIHTYSSYLAGLMMGLGIALFVYHVKNLLDTPLHTVLQVPAQEILQVPAVEEFQPLTKYEGWVNEFPETYNPHTYHISQTQSAFLRLQGNLLRMSHTRTKVPKRALWNEHKIRPVFTHHRVYNLLGAQITLLPEGLAKKRHWSKKYPICITLNKDQLEFDSGSIYVGSVKEEEPEGGGATKPKRFTLGGGKKRSHTLRFSKLSEENEEFDMDSETSRASTPSPLSPDDLFYDNNLIDEDQKRALDQALHDSLHKLDDDTFIEDELDTLPEDWGTFTPPDEENPNLTKLYIFGRTDREKEDWFRRLKAATHSRDASTPDRAANETEYMKYILVLNKISPSVENQNHDKTKTKLDIEAPPADLQWMNALLARVLFDCLRDNNFTQRIKDKIQKKLSTIKLPYFIESLVVTELSLGETPPLLHRARKPVIDERGLWVDIDLTYDGLIVLILQTKLNLMKLKQPPPHDDSSKSEEKCAMFNSDVEDSAESTSDEENMHLFQNSSVLDSSGVPLPGLGGTSNTSKKFMRMVDKIAESKFFQAATEYRYIKKAMEGVSNTELRLKVEVKEMTGTLVLNVPPPPCDRVWIGFRPTPALSLSAQPIVGERNITYLRITSWIEKKLLLEFQKLMVIPNMEDFIVPVMSPKLPE